MMNRSPSRPTSKAPKLKSPTSPFAPGAFLSSEGPSAQQLCRDLANEAARRFAQSDPTAWGSLATSIIQELRAAGHDLVRFDSGDDWQEWQAEWHHPRGNFCFLVSFRAPRSVEVAWKTEEFTVEAKA
jgi:hypothetical protein